MVNVGLWVEIEAKPGKEDEVETFLKQGQVLVGDEPQTVAWFAVRMDDSRYGIFDAFEDDAGRDAHLTGAVAEALGAQAGELFASPPAIHKIDVIGDKLPSA
jgi:quinol monooxygenase YgiN